MIRVIAKTVPAIIALFGVLGITAGAGFGWPLTLLGAGLFFASLFV